MEDIYRSQFRLPYPLYERLKAAADQSGRSLNGELVYRLNMSLGGSDSSKDETAQEAEHSIVNELADKLAAPENRAELESLVAILYRLTGKGKTGKR